MVDLINSLRITLLVIFNLGIVARAIYELMKSQSDEQAPSPMKIILHHVKIAVVFNLAASIVIVVQTYYMPEG